MLSWQQRVAFVILSVVLSAFPAGAVVITDTADTYIDSQNPTTAYGGSLAMEISQHSSGLLRFASLANALPFGTTSSQIAKANLQLWVIPDSVNNAGSFSIYEVTASFIASTVTYNTRPAVASLPVGTASAGVQSRYVEIDITPLVQKWVATPTTNLGIAIMPSSSSPTLDLLIGTKWNTAGSQPPILDITLVGPQGPAGPQGPTGPPGPQGPAAATMYSLCASDSLSPISCSCPHVLSRTEVTGSCDRNGFCSANIPDHPCATTAWSNHASCSFTYYGVCCVCTN